MWIELFIRGLGIGLMASILMGPIAILCIQRTLSKNLKSGFASGLGIASADTIFASIAFFSLSMVMTFMQTHLDIIKFIGGVCILWIGTRIFLSNPAVQIRRNRAGKTDLWSDFISILLLTLANPVTILTFIALFATLGIKSESIHPWHGLVMITGVFIGATLWWFTLTFLINIFRTKFKLRHILWMNRVAGGIIMLLGLLTILLIFINIPLLNELS